MGSDTEDMSYISPPLPNETATFPLPPGVGVGLSRCPHGSPLTLRRRSSLIAPSAAPPPVFIDSHMRTQQNISFVAFKGVFDGIS